MSTRTIHRYVIRADGDWYPLDVTGQLIHVATRDEDYTVELWFFANEQPPHVRAFRAYGTGWPDVEGEHVGTAITPSGRLVWHVMERAARRPASDVTGPYRLAGDDVAVGGTE